MNGPDSGGPGSPYRSSGSINGLGLGLGPGLGSARPSLNKELMQKLRSMTETIKMLTDENAELRKDQRRSGAVAVEEGERRKGGCWTRWRHICHVVIARSPSAEDYEDLTKPQLIALVVSYDEKLKALSSELSALNRTRGEAAGNKGQEKDKYKALARRLKEERNQYKETCEEKL